MGAWRRSHDAILVHRHTKDYDKFSQSQRQIRIACPRGWQRIKDRPEQGYLATCSRRTHAAPTIADVYIQDRTAQTISYELTSTFRKTVAEIHREAADNIGLKVIGHSVHYYTAPHLKDCRSAKSAVLAHWSARSRSRCRTSRCWTLMGPIGRPISHPRVRRLGPPPIHPSSELHLRHEQDTSFDLSRCTRRAITLRANGVLLRLSARNRRQGPSFRQARSDRR